MLEHLHWLRWSHPLLSTQIREVSLKLTPNAQRRWACALFLPFMLIWPQMAPTLRTPSPAPPIEPKVGFTSPSSQKANWLNRHSHQLLPRIARRFSTALLETATLLTMSFYSACFRISPNLASPARLLLTLNLLLDSKEIPEVYTLTLADSLFHIVPIPSMDMYAQRRPM